MRLCETHHYGTHNNVYVTVFWKTGHVVTNTEIHFLPVDESHTHPLSRHTMQVLESRWPGLLLQAAVFRHCKIMKVHFMAPQGH